jgi:catechol 2,3-dioxygenase-like lactoylglutathione lyase family enzyme
MTRLLTSKPSQAVGTAARFAHCLPMSQHLSLITLSIHDLGRSCRFYGEGFGWKPVYESGEVLFFQMNGIVLGLWLHTEFSADLQRADGVSNGFALAHNVSSVQEVDSLIARLADHGGHILRVADAPPYGGWRGYVADPDGHAWEIAWNPAWTIDEEGRVTFGT